MGKHDKQLMADLMIASTGMGGRLFRNNCGLAIEPGAKCPVCQTLARKTGRWIRFGVGNPGGSDLIGLFPVEVTEEMVGHKVGIFTACEVKVGSDRLRKEQKQFLKMIESLGGIAIEARTLDDLLKAWDHD